MWTDWDDLIKFAGSAESSFLGYVAMERDFIGFGRIERGNLATREGKFFKVSKREFFDVMFFKFSLLVLKIEYCSENCRLTFKISNVLKLFHCL